MRDVLARGVADPDIPLDLLGDKNQNMTLEEVIQFVEAKESGKRSASRLIDSHAAEATSGAYRKTKQVTLKDKNEVCSYCGKKGHGKSAPARIRETDCPAYGNKCGHCTCEHYFESVCRNQDKMKSKVTTNPQNHESAVFDALCAASSVNGGRRRKSMPITMGHHLYDHLSDTWIKKLSKPQPFIRVTISAHNEDYDNFGVEYSSRTKSAVVSAMAYTGCQSCLAGMKVITKLGLKQADLIPVTLKMHAANGNGINILGADILRITETNYRGETVETRQMTYITDCSDKLFLSWEACIAFGIISDSFPTIRETHASAITDILDNNDYIAYSNTSQTDTCSDGTSLCDCPKCALPSAIPTELPFEACEDNRAKLQEYLLDHYKSSTFNTCEHQPLLLMKGSPLRLMINPDATPVAHHTPVHVPLQWQEEVKAALDRDVRLGVIEAMPVGQPVTWCHRMVICAKRMENHVGQLIFSH